jgi:hypothetical protein
MANQWSEDGVDVALVTVPTFKGRKGELFSSDSTFRKYAKSVAAYLRKSAQGWFVREIVFQTESLPESSSAHEKTTIVKKRLMAAQCVSLKPEHSSFTRTGGGPYNEGTSNASPSSWALNFGIFIFD